MKNLLGAAVFLAIAAIIGNKLYERARETDWLESDSSEEEVVASTVVLSYPDGVQLANREGRVLDVTLLGRSSSHVQFRRVGGGEPFVYSIDMLDSASQRLVRQYPESGIQNASDHLSRGEMSLVDNHVENLRNEIRKIDSRCDIIGKKYAASSSKTERRTLRNEYEELQKERVAFEEDIAEHLAN